MSLNTLESLILESCHSPESNKIYDIVENFPKYEKCQIQLHYFEKLCKIPFKLESTTLLYCFGKVIETLLFYKILDMDSFSPNSFIDLLNCLIHVYERIAGTNLSRSLLCHIEENMALLLKRDELNEEEKNLIKEFNEDLNYKKYGIFEGFEDSGDVEEILFYVKSKHIEDKICGTQKLIHFMNNTKSFEEQLELMAKKLPNIIKHIIQDGYQKDERKIKDLMLELSKLMTTLIGDYEFFVKTEREIFANYRQVSDDDKEFKKELGKNIYVYIDGKGEIIQPTDTEANSNLQKQSNQAIVHYKIVNYEDTLRNFENIYSSLALIINTILLYPHSLELHELSFRVLSKLYIIFPKFRKNLEEPILTILTRISENEVSEVRKEISVFLFKLTHKIGTQEFVKVLSSKPSLKVFYDSPFYSEKVFKSHENTLEAINPSHLVIRTIFPIEKKIDAGSCYYQIIEVFHPFSIIYIGFAAQYYDITLRLKLICLFSKIKSPVLKEEELLIFEKEGINASKNSCRVVYFAKKPGLYKIEFDNTYSWMNEKCIRFKILVLQPQNLEFFMTGESLDNIVEEVKTYESLDIAEQKKLVKKLSTSVNKISLENNSQQKSTEKAENQLERLKSILRDGQDTQLILHLNLDTIFVIIKSSKTESEWIVTNGERETFDLNKFFGKVNDFFKRKQSLEENEPKNSEKQSISIIFCYNQEAMETFLKKNLKSFKRIGSFKQQISEIFNFDQNLPKYFEAIYYYFVRDSNFFLQTCIPSGTFSLQKKECFLLIYFSQGPKDKSKHEIPFIQALIFDKKEYNNGLFQAGLGVGEDLTQISLNSEGSLKKNYRKVIENESNEGRKEKIRQLFEVLIYNAYAVYGERIKMIVFWEPGNRKLEDDYIKMKDLEELKVSLKTRLDEKLELENWVFEDKYIKNLNEIE